MPLDINLVAQGLLAQREHSKYELTKKLLAKGFDSALIDSTLKNLTQQGLQSDFRYAELCLISRLNKGYGINYIRQYLQSKGVEAEVIDEIIHHSEADWLNGLHRLWQKKFAKVPQDIKEKMRQQRFFYYRGFDTETVNELFNLLKENHE